MLNREDLIKKLRLFMKEEKINFLIVFSTNEYLSEYVNLNENARYILTGFSGSTGDALITTTDIFLFVDGRYHLQADEEVDKNVITVVKVGMEESPQMALYKKIFELSDHQAKIGIITTKISCFGFRRLLDLLSKKNVKYKEFDFDPVLKIAEISQTKKISELKFIPDEISGMPAKEKLDLVIKNNHENNIDVLIITRLEEIAYLTNLRGNEISYSSSFKAKALINSEKCFIFTDLNRITSEIKEKLGNKFIFESEDEDFSIELEKFTPSINVGYDITSTNLKDCRKIERLRQNLIQIKDGSIALMKSVKNAYELEHMKECFLKTDIVVSRAICWLNKKLEENYSQKISEKDFSDKVKSLFFEEGATELSFEPIVASGRNSAFIHYTKANPEKFIQNGELMLLDCGAYFEGGYATDITRTFLAGGKKAIADSKQKEVYTKVLKGFLNGINFELKKGATGFDIDKKVREVIEKDKPEGFNFSHGTGHGIGIGVHESPPRLGPSESSMSKLLAGMCFTIEPGLYCDDFGGVRIENTVTITSDMKIKTLTKANLDDNLINYELLNEQEKIWLENYKKQAIG